ncbi:MAG TPA: glycosyltransferase family A protein [Pyrinomonadaceae bacterium]|nr:glycosyltransferase family A protein [Pyrinomonadaceae bacterium]
MKETPLVSVIIPVYNYARYLGEAIESVLGQTYQHLEVIVVDDGSTDGSGEVARSFAGLRYCHQVHAGIGPARNKGVEVAQGEFIAFLDADDRWPVEKLDRQLRAFENDPALEMCFGQALQLQNGPEWEAGVNDKRLDVAGMVPGMVPGTMLIKRDAFLRVGKFQGDWKVGEFIDWYARAVELKLRSLVLPELLLWRRIHDSNQGVRERQSVTDYARVLKAKLDRKRAEAKS